MLVSVTAQVNHAATEIPGNKEATVEPPNALYSCLLKELWEFLDEHRGLNSLSAVQLPVVRPGLRNVALGLSGASQVCTEPYCLW